MRGVCNLERWLFFFDECGLRFGLFGKEVSFRGDYVNGWIDDFVLIFLIEFEGDFDYLILVFEGLFGILKVIFFF